MLIDNSEVFTKENLDLYLRELSKEYKKCGGRHTPIEIILIGGAAILENYGFREMTTDVDAVLPSVSIMQDAINHVGDQFGLPNGWLNADFVKTESYSNRLSQYSTPYKVFNQVLNVRTVTGEYLIAMKLRAGRKYKNDLSDVVGILAEHERMGKPISFDMIDTAVKNLYGGWEQFSEESISFIHNILELGNYTEIYEQIREGEARARQDLLDFQESYPGELQEDNINRILEAKARQEERTSLAAKLRERRNQTTAKSPSHQKQHKSREER